MAIDTRVLKMEFDSEKFNRGVRETKEYLDQMNGSMADVVGNEKTFDTMGDNLQKVADKFSALGVIGMSVLNNLANRLADWGVEAVKSLGVDNLTAGFSQYEQKVSSVQQMMAATRRDLIENGGELFANTGEQAEYVNSQLERMAWFADETSYSLEGMTSTMSKFMSSGISMDQANKDMMGIATWAASAGANATQATHVMEQLAQALGTGYIMAQDWASVESSGMSGLKDFNETLIQTAVEMGTVEKSADGMYKAVNGKNTFNENSIRKSLSDRWLTIDVLEKTLSKYGNFAYELYDLYEETGKTTYDILSSMDPLAEGFDKTGYYAFKAAQETKTFTEAIEATKTGVKTAYSEIFETIIGDYTEATELWSTFSDWLYEKFVEPVHGTLEIVKAWKDLTSGGRDDLIAFFEKLGPAIDNVIQPIKDGVNSVFHIFDSESDDDDIRNSAIQKKAEFIGSIVNKLNSIIDKLTLSPEQMEKLTEIVTTLSEYVKSGGEVILEFLSNLWNMIKKFGDSALVQTAVNSLESLGDSVVGFGVKVGYISGGVISKLFDVVSDVLDGITEFIDSTNISESAVKLFEKVFNNVRNFFAGVFSFLLDGQNLITLLIGGTSWEMISWYTGTMVGYIKDMMVTFSEFLDGLGKYFETSAWNVAATAFKNFATAMLILAAGLLVLSRIDVDGLGRSLSAVAVMSTILLGMYAGITVISSTITNASKTLGIISSATNFLKVTSVLVTLSAAIATLSLSLVAISLIDPNKLAESVLALATIMGALLIGVKIVSELATVTIPSGSVAKIVLIMGTITSCLTLLSVTLNLMRFVNAESIVKLGVVLTALLGAVAIMSRIGQIPSAGIVKAGVTMAIVSSSLAIISAALLAFDIVTDSAAQKALISLTAVLTITGILGAIGDKAAVALKASVSIATISASLAILAAALVAFSIGVSWDGVARASTALSGVIIIFTTIGTVLSGMSSSMLTAAAIISAISASLALLGASLIVLSAVKIKSTAEGLASLVLVMGAFLALSPLVTAFAPMLTTMAAVMIPLGAAATVVSVAILALSASVYILVSALEKVVDIIVGLVGLMTGQLTFVDYFTLKMKGSSDSIGEGYNNAANAAVSANNKIIESNKKVIRSNKDVDDSTPKKVSPGQNGNERGRILVDNERSSTNPRSRSVKNASDEGTEDGTTYKNAFVEASKNTMSEVADAQIESITTNNKKFRNMGKLGYEGFKQGWEDASDDIILSWNEADMSTAIRAMVEAGLTSVEAMNIWNKYGAAGAKAYLDSWSQYNNGVFGEEAIKMMAEADFEVWKNQWQLADWYAMGEPISKALGNCLGIKDTSRIYKGVDGVTRAIQQHIDTDGNISYEVKLIANFDDASWRKQVNLNGVVTTFSDEYYRRMSNIINPNNSTTTTNNTTYNLSVTNNGVKSTVTVNSLLSATQKMLDVARNAVATSTK